VIRWFKTRRRLHEDLRLLNVIIADREQTIADLDEEMKEAEAVAEARIAELQESLRLAHRAMDTQRRLRIEADDKLARVVDELKALHVEIRTAEQADV